MVMAELWSSARSERTSRSEASGCHHGGQPVMVLQEVPLQEMEVAARDELGPIGCNLAMGLQSLHLSTRVAMVLAPRCPCTSERWKSDLLVLDHA
jgi:hypothetical protein